MPIAAFFFVSRFHLEERFIWEQRIPICRELVIREPDSQKYTIDLADSLFNYAASLHHSENLPAACVAHEEAIALRRRLVAREPDKDRLVAHLALALHNYGITLGSRGLIRETLRTEKEAAELWRKLYQKDPPRKKYRVTLAQTLYNYGVSLAELVKDPDGHQHRLDEAMAVLEECISLRRRQQLDADQFDAYKEDKQGIDLAKTLFAYGWVLHGAKRYGDACFVEEESVKLFRSSVVPNNTMRQPELAAALHNYGASLHQAGRIDEACVVYGEAVVLRRFEYDRDPLLFKADLDASLHDYELCLSIKQHTETFIPDIPDDE